MKINITFPFDRFQIHDEFLHHAAIVEMARVAERAGFFACCVTDHPAPTGRWLDAGGHEAQDPFVLLAFVAAATTTLRVQTGILVLPYRNPFVVARSVSTLDVLSGGRVRLGVGAGYLKGEYRALGIDFDSRNELMDEYIRAMQAAWTQEEFAFEGTGYSAPGNRILPLPVQKPHPPILVGGNSRRAIRRAAELGQAWNPFPTHDAALAATSRTADLSSEDGLAEGIAYLRAHCAAIGRETPPAVELGGLIDPRQTGAALIDTLGRYAALGVGAVDVAMAGRTRAEWCDNAARFGEEIIATLD